MGELEMLYLQKELKDIKAFCIKKGLTALHNGKTFYLYNNKIYDENMDVVVEYAENGFADLTTAKED